MKIYHNPRCSKSRQTLKLINESGREVEIIEYLKMPPSKKELKQIIKQLGIKPFDLIRTGEPIFKVQYKGAELTDNQWIELMVRHPILIERPIVISGDRAVLGRPPEKVQELW